MTDDGKSIYKPSLFYGAVLSHVRGPKIEGPLRIVVGRESYLIEAHGLGLACGGHGMGQLPTVAAGKYQIGKSTHFTLEEFEAVADR